MSVNKYGEAWEEQETGQDDMVFKLIALRQKYNNVFSGKRGSARDGWTTIASELGLVEHSYKILQKKWQNLVQKYKEVRNPNVADGPTTTTWIFYNAMDQVLGDPEVANSTIIIDNPRGVRHVVQSSEGDTRNMIEFDFSDISLAQDSSEPPFKKKKVTQGYDQQDQPFSNNQSVQYVDGSEAPLWFREFLNTYRQDEAKRMDVLKSMHHDIMRLERKKCALLQELISKLSADDEILSETDPLQTSVSESGAGDHPTTTLTVTVNQSDSLKCESACSDSQEPDEETELRVVQTAEVLEDDQIIIKPEQAISAGESLVTLSQSSLTRKTHLRASKAVLNSVQGVTSPVKFIVASHGGSVRSGQPLLIKATPARGKLLVPMRKLTVPACETSNSVCLTGSVLGEGMIDSPEYQCIDTSDSGQ